MDSSIPSSQKKTLQKHQKKLVCVNKWNFIPFSFLPSQSHQLLCSLSCTRSTTSLNVQLWMCAPNETSSISQWLAASEFSICLKIDSKPMRLRKLLRKAGFGCETCSRLGSKNSRALCIIVHYRLMISHLLLSATTSRSTMTCSELIRDTICAKIRHNPISAQVKEVRATNRH